MTSDHSCRIFLLLFFKYHNYYWYRGQGPLTRWCNLLCYLSISISSPVDPPFTENICRPFRHVTLFRTFFIGRALALEDHRLQHSSNLLYFFFESNGLGSDGQVAWRNVGLALRRVVGADTKKLETGVLMTRKATRMAVLKKDLAVIVLIVLFTEIKEWCNFPVRVVVISCDDILWDVEKMCNVISNFTILENTITPKRTSNRIKLSIHSSFTDWCSFWSPRF